MTRRVADDLALGMDRRITRRDFVNGMAVAVGGAMMPRPWWLFPDDEYAPEKDPGYYPPALTGMRGSHPGSFEAAHMDRDGQLGALLSNARDTGEQVDLVVVGAGISGLSAAHFYRKAMGPTARILLLDNHDDFGGHAKRNEFTVGGKTLLGYGGTQSLDGPQHYSAVAKHLLVELGVDVERFHAAFDQRFYSSRGMAQGVFLDKETFGADHLAVGAGVKPWAEVLARAPLSDAVRADIVRVYEGRTDYMPGVPVAKKLDALLRMSYRDYLVNVMKVAPAAVPFFQTITHDLFGVGIDAVPAGYLHLVGFPGGFQGMGIPGEDGAMVRAPAHPQATPPDGYEPYIFHFPDGNASVARLLVRRLIPGALPGHGMDDVVTARVNYARLDDPSSRTRLRLNSTVLNVRTSTSPGISVTYMRGGKAWTVRAHDCVLACWHMMIPYLCPELPQAQRDALHDNTKVPLVYTNVAFRNWRAFAKAGIARAYVPSGFHTLVELDFPVSLGAYHFSSGPDDPIVAHLLRTPCKPGLSAREQHRAGRRELLTMTFEQFERATREQLARMLGPSGFDPARDIAGITVNRWPHGYCYFYNTLWDATAWPGAPKPYETARRRYGRIAIANCDAGGMAYTNVAIDQAHRAVHELVGTHAPVRAPAPA